mmetsp:Transcript_23890/g.42331  ORF Transcript_23890/g.42331 Transcript_23890/m.42331 type:complete len:285 (+) Transcript_23890:174-1028(+)
MPTGDIGAPPGILNGSVNSPPIFFSEDFFSSATSFCLQATSIEASLELPTASGFDLFASSNSLSAALGTYAIPKGSLITARASFGKPLSVSRIKTTPSPKPLSTFFSSCSALTLSCSSASSLSFAASDFRRSAHSQDLSASLPHSASSRRAAAPFLCAGHRVQMRDLSVLGSSPASTSGSTDSKFLYKYATQSRKTALDLVWQVMTADLWPLRRLLLTALHWPQPVSVARNTIGSDRYFHRTWSLAVSVSRNDTSAGSASNARGASGFDGSGQSGHRYTPCQPL